MSNSPIFIVASERSGTNLLRTLLSNHPHLDGPLATHLIHVFYEFKDRYGDLSKKENIKKVFEHFKASVNHVYTNWGIEIAFDEFYEKYKPNSMIAVFHGLHLEKVGENRRYVCKDKNLYDNLPEIAKEVPEAKFIYLYRDPRDYVVSNLKTPRSLWTVYDNAVSWKVEQDQCLKRIGEGYEMHKVKYEDLVSNTPAEMTKILEFIDEPIDEACFSTDQKRNKKDTWNQHWKNLDKPVMSDNFNKFKKSLSTSQINMIESICKENMDTLGYETITKTNWKPGSLSSVMNRLDHITKKVMRLGYVLKHQKLSAEKNQLNRELVNQLSHNE